MQLWRVIRRHAGTPLQFLTVAAAVLSLAAVNAQSVRADGAHGARAATPQQQKPAVIAPLRPILHIQPRMHNAVVRRIAADAMGQYLVTGSDDKTARVWNLSDGRLIEVLRPPIDEGREGRVESVAISPDGGIVACGGWFSDRVPNSYAVILFDRATGGVTRRLGGLPDIANDLSFSPDGHYLAVGLASGGLRVLGVSDGATALVDKDYAESVYGTDWDVTGRLITSCFDGSVRLYSALPDMKLAAKVDTPDGKHPYAVRFSPDGSLVAVGYDDVAAVSVLSGVDLKRQYAPVVDGISPGGNFSRVCWSSDGNALFAAGTAQNGTNSYVVRSWTGAGRGAVRDTAVARNYVADLRTVPATTRGASVAYVAGEPTWGLVSTLEGKSGVGRLASTADFRGMGDAFGLAPDGSVVKFRYAQSDSVAARFSLKSRELNTAATVDPSNEPVPAIVKADGIEIQDWQNSPKPTCNGKALSLDANEIAGCLAIALDKSRFALGTSSYLRCFNADGTEAWKTPSPDVTCAVTISGNGKLVAAAFADGTIRWYRAKDGAELLAFYPDADKRRWVTWTPQGYYDCSPFGEELIGWYVKTASGASAYYPAEHFEATYHRPDVLDRLFAMLTSDNP